MSFDWDDNYVHAMLARMRLWQRACSFLVVLFLTVLPLSARVLRVQIATRTDVLNGKAFGNAGAYERVTGRVYFSLPVANPHNQRIVDLGNAVNLKNGEVEFSSDFIAIRPRMRTGATAPCCWKFPTAAIHVLLPWWTGATGMSRMTPETRGCCATATPL